MSILFFLLACTKTSDPAPKDVTDVAEPAPVDGLVKKTMPSLTPPEPAPEPAVEAKTDAADGPILAAWGQSCQPMPDGIPKNPNAVKTLLAEAGIEANVTPMPVCKACKMCPAIAVQIDVDAAQRADAEAMTRKWMEALSPAATP